MPIAPETVEEYFKQLDWPFQKNDDNTWVSGFKGDNAEFNFSVRTTDDWLFVYVPFPAEVAEAAQNTLYRHLLRLNFQMNMAKFLVDDDGDVGLTVEIPCSDLQLNEFKDALYAVCLYSDQHHDELVRLATDPHAVSSLVIAK